MGEKLEMLLSSGRRYLTPRAVVCSELSRALPDRPKTVRLTAILSAAGFTQWRSRFKLGGCVESVWTRHWDPTEDEVRMEFGFSTQRSPAGKKPPALGDRPPLERELEGWFVAEVKSRGGVTYKLDPFVDKGAPDRVVLLPGGAVLFVELKRAGFAPTPLQEHQLSRIRMAGGRAHWSASKAELLALLDAHTDVLHA